MRVLGCDPGLNGAMALWDDDFEQLVIRDMPTMELRVGKSAARRVIVDAGVAAIMRELQPDRVVIEKVGGLTGQSASAAFTFGSGYGVLRGCAAMLGVPVDFLSPPDWRSRMRVPPGKDGSRLRAGQIFPAYAVQFARKKDDGRAEAALIARALGLHPSASLMRSEHNIR